MGTRATFRKKTKKDANTMANTLVTAGPAPAPVEESWVVNGVGAL